MKHQLSSIKPRQLAPYLAGAELFKNLPPIVLSEVESALQWVTLAAGEVLFAQGEVGNSLYVLVEGRIGIKLSEMGESTAGEKSGPCCFEFQNLGTPEFKPQEFKVDDLRPGSILGEIALLTGQPRSTTVYAVENSALIRLTRAGFEQLSVKHPQLMTDVIEMFLPRIQREQLVSILTSLFGELDVTALHELQANLEWQHLTNGDILFRQDDPGDALYIVVNGRLKVVFEEAGGGEQVIGEIGPGEIAGEISLLETGVRSATLYAMRETDLVKLPNATFTVLAERYPQVLMAIARHTINRLREKQAMVAHNTHAMTIAVVPITDNVPLADFTHRLEHALAKLGRTLRLNGARLGDLYGQSEVAYRPFGHPSTSLLTNWLSTQENHFEYILYEADFTWTPWTERCLSQADRVLLVTTESSPAVSAFEEQVRHRAIQSHTELVLLHMQAKARPTNTHQWLEKRALDAYHHIRWTTDHHLNRLARRLAGRHIGLVLSGGGARGFMHIGTLQALEELQVDVDIVGGTSIGALVGAAYAMEHSAAEIYELFKPFASRRTLLDYTLPLVSMVSTRKIVKLIQELAGELRFEDLWRPFFAISANISDSLLHTHEQGALWKALRASMAAIPVFAPSLIDGDVHVDGSFMNNFPLDVMQERYHCHLLIGSDATSQGHKGQNYYFGSSISGWRVLWSKLNPFVKPLTVPTMLTLIDQVAFLNSAHHKQHVFQLANIMISPKRVSGYSSLDFAAYDELVAMGYEEAHRQISTWQQSRRNLWQGCNSDRSTTDPLSHKNGYPAVADSL